MIDMTYDEVMSHLQDQIDRGSADGRLALVAFRDYLREREVGSELVEVEVPDAPVIELHEVVEPVAEVEVHDEPITVVENDNELTLAPLAVTGFTRTEHELDKAADHGVPSRE